MPWAKVKGHVNHVATGELEAVDNTFERSDGRQTESDEEK